MIMCSFEAWRKRKHWRCHWHWNMPNCTGLDLLKRLRRDSRIGKTPFVMVTAESEGSQVSEAIAAGVNQYILKPFKADSLREKLATMGPG